jgi:hypothetical protein
VLKGKQMLKPKLDAAGNPELDDDGNPIMEEVADETDDEGGDDDENLTDDEKKQKEKDALAQVEKDKVKKALDAAYKERDEAKAKAEALEKEKREAEKEKLKEQGKLEEVHVIELAERDAELNKRDARIKELEKENVRLTRDASVRDSLASYDFRNPKARDVATSDITKLLKKDDDGEWVGKDGRSIEAITKAYLEDEDNTWLLKPSKSNGLGTTKSKPDSGEKDNKNESLFAMSTEQLLNKASKGQLPKRR